MIIDDYLQYSETYKSKYGNKCIVLMQVGSFYELYSIKDDTSEDIYTIADLCNIQISRKNKSIPDVSISNPLMAGFPLYTLRKFTNILLSNNYTIVLIEQVTEPPNPERKITEILSPGMNMNVSGKKSNYMMVVYYEFVDTLPVVGIAGIDLSTGNSFVYETGSTKQDPELVSDEVFRILTTYNPCELVILSNKKYDDSQKQYLLRNLNLSNILTHYKWESYEYIKCMQKLSYQTAILEKAYANKKNLLSIIETLNLEKYDCGRIALCCLLQFAYEHNIDIIKQLNVPDIINSNTYLSIEYNSAVQLNILGLYNHDKPLIDILNRCMTAFGSRIFKERLLKPIIDITKLNKRYDEIEYLLQENKFQKVSKLLCNILDLERIKRKMQVNKFNPQDWCGFNVSLENAVEILSRYYPSCDTALFQEMMQYYTKVLDFSELSKYNLNDIKGNIFVKGTYTEIDTYMDDFNRAYHEILSINQAINDIDSGDATSCKIDYNEKDGYFITMTKKRFDTAKARCPSLMKAFQVKTLSSSNTIKIVNEAIILASNTMEEKQALISKSVLTYYQLFVSQFIEKYGKILDDLIHILVDVDIACCGAKNAYEYRYYRPVIVDSNASFIKAANIRHPIIERIDDTTPYVGNDIHLSLKETNGMLLYGINAAGKSSLMKSVGLNIIMAQAGMFVASNHMEFYPYKHIFTRISGMDNIYKGMSSFTVEMTELRNILQRCDKYSLVLGDEICNGTEAVSALAIVAAGIDVLVAKKASFIFATHLHDLTDLQIIKSHICMPDDKTNSSTNYIKVSHIHITIDDNNRIIYERTLRDGRGSATYGIEVCKSLDMPMDFMKKAESIRKEVQGHSKLMIKPHRSKYNCDLYMSECFICKAPAIDTHHIQYQCNTDTEGFFKDFHKDIKHNLIPLCKECHNKEHNGEINIKGYKKSSEGVIVDVGLNPGGTNPVSYRSPVTSPIPQSIVPSHILDITDNANITDITDDEYSKIRQYIKRGRCGDWYMRTAKTHMYKKHTDEKKIIERINKLSNKKIKELSYDICSKLYDPSI